MTITALDRDSVTQPRSPAGYGSDVLVDLLARLGYRYVALNPGATFRGLHDSLVNRPGAPRVIQTTHEEIAVAVAHGYAKASGEPMAAAVHDVVGLQHASMAVFNAWCDQAPILVMGGTGPMDAARRRPFIDWVHTALVQGQLVRDFVKWDDQPASLAAATEALVRGDRIARAEPPGPVYVCLDVDIQEGPLEAPVDPILAPPPAVMGPDPDAIGEAAAWLLGAERPLAVADVAGRSTGAPTNLALLAEHLGMPVVDLGGRFNMPATHPLDATEAPDILGSPDVVLALDVVDLAGFLATLPPPRPARRVIHVSTRELGIRSLVTNYQRLPPVELTIIAPAGAALEALVKACRARPRPAGATVRAGQVARLGRARRLAWRSHAEATQAQRPIASAWLFHQLSQSLAARDWALVNGPIENPWPRRLLDIATPQQYLGGSGGAGIGYAAGASVGAALALAPRGILPVDVQGDGDLLYTPGAIWTAVHERIPLLMIVADNRSYHNSEHHQRSLAERRARPLERASIGTRIDDPPVDFAGLARSMGASGYGPVTDPGALRGALEAAIGVVGDGGVAVVDVICQAR